MKKTIILSFLLVTFFSCVDNKYLTLEKKLFATIATKIDTLTAALTEIEKTKDEKELMLKFKETRKEYKKLSLIHI